MTAKLAASELGSLLHTQSSPIPVEVDVTDLLPMTVTPEHSGEVSMAARFAHTVQRSARDGADSLDPREQPTRPSRVQKKPAARAAVHPDADRATRKCDPRDFLGLSHLAEGSDAELRLGAPASAAAATERGAVEIDLSGDASTRASTASDSTVPSARPRARGTRRPVVAIPMLSLAKGSNTEMAAIGDGASLDAVPEPAVPEPRADQRSRRAQSLATRSTEMPDARIAIAMAVGVWLAVVIVAWLMFASL
ncbi:MAG TPA: hypothetical protein VGM88_01925 [Kofleriaceae bacterium]